MMIRILLIGILLFAGGLHADRPNVVFILSDDQAWGDYSFMGHDHIETPRLDGLAEESVLFTKGYVVAPLCRPSLMSLATGMYPHETRITGNDPTSPPPPPWGDWDFPRERLLANIDRLPTLHGVLGDHGYLTMQSGKWWEGSYQRGGFTHGMTEGERHGDKGLVIGRETMQPIFDFIDEAQERGKPFYLWYAPFLPHTPHNPPERLMKKYIDKIPSYRVARYYAMCEWFDETCGQLLDHLEAEGLRENTIIYYACDNGWIQSRDHKRAAPGSKMTVTEAGIRTPIMVSWPDKLEPGVREERILSIDLVPTILSAVGLDAPDEVSGKDLWRSLRKGKPVQRDIIFGEGYRHDMVDPEHPEKSLLSLWAIEDDWKLIISFENEIVKRPSWHAPLRDQGFYLYNLKDDPRETRDLTYVFPDKVDRLAEKILDWYPFDVNSRILGALNLLNTQETQGG